jgi:hypothetical protein
MPTTHVARSQQRTSAPRSRRPAANAALWLGLYVAAVALPLFALLPGQASAGRGFAWDFDL